MMRLYDRDGRKAEGPLFDIEPTGAIGRNFSGPFVCCSDRKCIRFDVSISGRNQNVRCCYAY